MTEHEIVGGNPLHEDDQWYGEGDPSLAEVLAASGVRPPFAELPDQLTNLRETWRPTDIRAELDSFLRVSNFVPRHEHVLPPHDRIPFYKRLAEGVENYAAKHTRNREKGRDESAEFGTGRIGEHSAVIYSMNFDFMGGSLATVAGERYLQALELAETRSEPLICVYSSGGARQDENVRALYQMERVVAGIEMLREKATHVPVISVVMGELWGGVTASSMPRGDYRIAITGSRMGFAGQRVIETAEGRAINPNDQRVEAHALLRHVDYLVDDVGELYEHLQRLFDITHKPKRKFDETAVPRAMVAGTGTGERVFEFRERAIDNPFRDRVIGEKVVRFSAELRTESDFEDLLSDAYRAGHVGDEAQRQALGRLLEERYRNLLFDAARPDSELLMRIAFRDVVPLYNRFYDAERQVFVHPHIIAGIGKIGNQPFLVMGDQPSYDISSGKIVKRLATPRPVDMRYMQRMLEFGNRLDLPLVLFTDTPGAQASLKAEQEGQFDYIADILAMYPHYQRPIISVIHGLQGSGGGLITSPRGDSLAMTSRALMSVAEPGSAAVIIYGDDATPENRRDTLAAFGPDAQTQLADRMINAIIDESENPYETAVRVQDHIIRAFDELNRLSAGDLRKRRWERLRHATPFEVVPVHK